MNNEEIVKKMPKLHWYQIIKVNDVPNQSKKKLGEVFGVKKKMELIQYTLNENKLDFVVWYELRYLGMTKKGETQSMIRAFLNETQLTYD